MHRELYLRALTVDASIFAPLTVVRLMALIPTKYGPHVTVAPDGGITVRLTLAAVCEIDEVVEIIRDPVFAGWEIVTPVGSVAP